MEGVQWIPTQGSLYYAQMDREMTLLISYPKFTKQQDTVVLWILLPLSQSFLGYGSRT